MNADMRAVSAMLSVEAAQAELLHRARTIQEVQVCQLNECDSRVLATSVESPIAVPAFDNSAMDGYALNLSPHDALPDVFPVVQRIAAGQAGMPLSPGSAARIFTGAPIPLGANVVVPQEEAELLPEGIRVHSPRVGQHIRLRGEDIQVGQTILSQGTRLQPRHVGLAASVGVPSLTVYRQLKVGMFFTGDELVEPGGVLDCASVYNSNRYAIGSLLRSLGCAVTDYGVVRDDREATLDMLQRASVENDLVITSGGVSVGDEDHVKAAVMTLGQLDLWQVAIKPGKPFAFGKIGQADFIGLPGNPVAAFVTFFLLAQPFIKRTQGIVDCLPQRFEVLANFSWSAKGRKREFLRVREQVGPDLRLTVSLSSCNQGAAAMTSIGMADGLVDVEPGSQIVPGDRVIYYPMGCSVRGWNHEA